MKMSSGFTDTDTLVLSVFQELSTECPFRSLIVINSIAIKEEIYGEWSSRGLNRVEIRLALVATK